MGSSRSSAMAAGCGVVLLLLGGCTTPRPDPAPSPALSVPSGGDGWRYGYVAAEFDREVIAIAAGSASDAWAVDRKIQEHTEPGLLRYDGATKTWRRQSLPAALTDIRDRVRHRLDASAADNAWLFSGSDSAAASTPAFVARWDGTAWRPVPVPADFPYSVLDTAVFGRDDVWVAGEKGSAEKAPNGSELWHWDGARWRHQALPFQPAGIDGTSHDAVWAVGTRQSAYGSPPEGNPHDSPYAAARFDGRTWHHVPVPAPELPEKHMGTWSMRLDQVATPPGRDVWAYGDMFGDAGDDSYQRDFLLHWNGTRWSYEPAPRLTTCCSLLSDLGTGGGLLLDSHWYRDPRGGWQRIPRPAYVPRPGGGLTAYEKRHQRFRVNAAAPIPGTGSIWGASDIGGQTSAEPTKLQPLHQRATILRFTPPG